MGMYTIPRFVQSILGFTLAGLGIAVICTAYPPNSTPRELWLEALTIMLTTIGLIGGGIGAIFGNFWVGFGLGIILPLIAFVLFAMWGMFC